MAYTGAYAQMMLVFTENKATINEIGTYTADKRFFEKSNFILVAYQKKALSLRKKYNVKN